MILDKIRESKGVATAKGKLIDYGEAHALQYAFFRGFVTIRWSSYRSKIKANDMALDVWEASEGQYQDTALTVGYIANKVFLGGLAYGGLLSL